MAERRPSQLTEVLAAGTLEKERGSEVIMPQHTEQHERAVGAGQLLEGMEYIGSIYLLLHRNKNVHLLSDDQIIEKLRNENYMRVPSMSQHKCLRTK